MEEQPLVTVVVPAYNAERFIERTLHSALGQTYRNLEVLVIDDGSTDTTGHIASKFAQADKRVRVIRVANGGVARARNTGIHAAAGEFVAFLDADDLWHPTKVELQVAALVKGTDCAVAVYVLARDIGLDDRVFKNGKPVLFTGYTFARHLYLTPVGNGSSLMVRREVALAVGGFEPGWAAQGLGGCEDLDFELKLAAKYAITAIPLYLVGYRYSPGNMSSDRSRMARAAMATIAHHMVLSPGLPVWAERAIVAAASAYALTNFIAGRHWRLAISEFLRLCRFDLMRGLRVTGRILKRELCNLPWLARRTSPQSGEQPLYFQMDPASGVDVSLETRRPSDQKIICELARVDAGLAERLNVIASQALRQAAETSPASGSTSFQKAL